MLHWSLLPAVLLATALDPTALGPVPAGTLRVCLVRHGEAYTNLDPAPKGMTAQALDALTERGRQQVDALAARLATQRIALIVHSPAGRARETASRLQGVRATGLQVRSELRPMEVGLTPEGNLLEWSARIAQWKAGQDPRPPKGESLADVGQRVESLLGALFKTHVGGSVVCVSHSEVLGAFLGALRGKPPAARYPFEVGLASVTVIDWRGPGDFSERLTNYTAP